MPYSSHELHKSLDRTENFELHLVSLLNLIWGKLLRDCSEHSLLMFYWNSSESSKEKGQSVSQTQCQGENKMPKFIYIIECLIMQL